MEEKVKMLIEVSTDTQKQIKEVTASLGLKQYVTIEKALQEGLKIVKQKHKL